jgi:hypothetical protein
VAAIGPLVRVYTPPASFSFGPGASGQSAAHRAASHCSSENRCGAPCWFALLKRTGGILLIYLATVSDV